VTTVACHVKIFCCG